MDLSNVRNIIFDLGNVLIDLDPQKTIKAFKDLGFAQIEEFQGHSRSMGFTALFQEGKMDDKAFYDEVRRYAGKPLTDIDIADAWNAMLLHYDTRRIQRLIDLKQRYRLFLFSNTNEVHHRNFAFRVPLVGSIDKLFERTFYSHEIGLAKPSTESFELVLRQAGIKAHETLFLDDLPENVEGAQKVGMQARLVEYPNQWLEWLPSH
jgi:FMN phosphatase YigB (HAD superfamily)